MAATMKVMACAAALLCASAPSRAFTLDDPGDAANAATAMAATFRATCLDYHGRYPSLRADAVKTFGYSEFPSGKIVPWHGRTFANGTQSQPSRLMLGSGKKTDQHVMIVEGASNDADQVICEVIWFTQKPIPVGALLDALELTSNVKLSRISMTGAPPTVSNNRHGCGDIRLAERAVKICADEWRDGLYFSLTLTPAKVTG